MFLLSIPVSVNAEICTECHGIPSDNSHKIHSSTAFMSPVYGDTGFTYRYSKDAGEYAFNCGNCHPGDISRHNNGSVEIELYSASSSGLKKLNSEKALFDKTTKTCYGVYCHSSGEKSASIEFRETPAWGSSFGEFKCQGCHGTPPSYKNEKGRENSHFNSERGSGHLLGIHWDSVKGHTRESLANKISSDMGCSTCHYSTVSEDKDTTFTDGVTGLFTCSRCHDNRTLTDKNRTGIISNISLHVNGIIEVSFRPEKFRTTAQLTNVPYGWNRTEQKGSIPGYDETVKALNSAQYNPEEKTCINVACHLLGTEVSWGDKIECDSCHRDFMFKK
ncbi:MAG: CxxxxCH/CxxCH domain-containing protein [Nitrospirota bacterium]